MTKQQFIEKLRDRALRLYQKSTEFGEPNHGDAQASEIFTVANELEAMDVVWVPREIDTRFRGTMQHALDSVAANPDAEDEHGNRIIWTDAVYRAVVRKAENTND